MTPVSQVAYTTFFILLLATFTIQYGFVGTIGDFVTHRRGNEVFTIPDRPAYWLAYFLSATPLVVASLLVRMASNTVSTRSRRIAWGMGAASSVAAFVLVMSRWSLLCDYNAADLDRMCEFTNVFIQEMRADPAVGPNAIWTTNGTLLAIARNDPTNKMLRNDHDFDFCFDLTKLDAIVAFAERHGYFYELLQDTRFKMRFWPSWARMHTSHSGVLIIDFEECNPGDDFEIVMISGCSGRMFPAAKHYLDMLLIAFGPRWMIPQALNHWLACGVFGGLGSL